MLASILPICDCGRSQTSIRSQVRIADFNEWIRYVRGERRRGLSRLLRGARRGTQLQAALTRDGFLPNDAGYDLMAPLAEQAVAAALATARDTATTNDQRSSEGVAS